MSGFDWNDVYVMTDPEGFKKMQEISWNYLKDKENIYDVVAIFPMEGEDPKEYFDFCDAQERYVCFGFDTALDWTEYDDYVKVFMKVLEIANYSGVKWQFLRIGPHGLIEEKVSDNFYNNPPMVLRA